MHGSSEYSQRVNTGTLSARVRDGYEKAYELRRTRRGVAATATGNEFVVCRAQLVPEVPRMFYGDGGQWASIYSHERSPNVMKVAIQD